jgi:flagellar basal-body rod protein FlgG
MIRSLWIAKTGMEASRPSWTPSRTTSPTWPPTASSAPASCSRISCTRTCARPARPPEQSQLPTGLQMGLGVRAAATSRNFSQGTLNQTSNSLDMAIEGQRLLPDPDARRHHRLHPRRRLPGGRQRPARHQHRLCRAAGHHDPGQCAHGLGRQGRLRVSHLARQAAPQVVGQMQLASFVNPAGSESLGGNLYAETAASGTPNAGAPGANGLGTVRGKALSRAATSTWSRSW